MGVYLGYPLPDEAPVPTPNPGNVFTGAQPQQQQPGGFAGFLQSPGFGNILQAMGASLMSSPRNAPLSNFGQFLPQFQRQSMMERQERQQLAQSEQERAALEQALIASGIDPAQARALSANPQAAKLQLDVAENRRQREQASAIQNSTVNWLMQRHGLSDEEAMLVAQNKEAMNNYLKPAEAAKPTDDMRELEAINQQRLAAGLAPYRLDEWITASKKSGATTVNVGGEMPDGNLRKKLDEKTGELWSTYQEQGATSAAASQDMAALDELIKVAPQGPLTGRAAEMFPGFSSAGDAFQSIVKRLAPTLRAPGSGSTSDIEYDGMLRSLPALRNTPEANAMISELMKAKAAINIERSRIVDAYGRGEIDVSQARTMIADLDKRSILTPRMRQVLNQIGGEAGSTTTDGWQDMGGGVRIRRK